MIKLIMILASLAISPVFAFSCFYTAVKTACWLNYEVTIKVMDGTNNTLLATAVIPKGKLWTRIPFQCSPNQELNYIATFQPTIWQKQANKIYSAQHFWSLPAQITKGSKAWNIRVCFPEAFAALPIPPQSTSTCTCDFNSIPPVPPQP